MKYPLSQKWLRSYQASQYIGRSAKTLANMRSLGTGPAFRKCDGLVIYDRADLDAYIESHPRKFTSSRPS
jgi:hypothetical protein